MKKNLSPRQLAQAAGVSESTIKRWVDDERLRAHRTAGGHRRIDVDEAVRFLRSNGIVPTSPEVLGLPMPFRDERPTLEEAAGILERALLDGDAEEVRGLIFGLYLVGHGAAAIIDGPIREAMSRIGSRWNDDPEGIFLEHRASDLCSQTLHQLRGWMRSEDSELVAVGGAIEGDPYQLPTLSVALVLSDLGVEAINLGPDCPYETLVGGARAHRARMVWLSVTSLHSPGKIVPAIADLARLLAQQQALLVVGGQGVQERSLTRIPNLRYLGDLGQLGELVTELQSPSP